MWAASFWIVFTGIFSKHYPPFPWAASPLAGGFGKRIEYLQVPPEKRVLYNNHGNWSSHFIWKETFHSPIFAMLEEGFEWNVRHCFFWSSESLLINALAYPRSHLQFVPVFLGQFFLQNLELLTQVVSDDWKRMKYHRWQMIQTNNQPQLNQVWKGMI